MTKNLSDREGGIRGIKRTEKLQLKLLRDTAKTVNSKLEIHVMPNNVYPKDPELSLMIDSGPKTVCRIFWLKAGIVQQETPMLPYRLPESFKSLKDYFKHHENSLKHQGYDYFKLSSKKDLAAWKKTLGDLCKNLQGG